MPAFDYQSDRGIVVPDTAETRAQVEEMHRDAWGEDVVLDPETPLGKVVVTDTLVLDAAARATAIGANAMNPDLAQGPALYGLGAMLRIYPRPAIPSQIADVVLTGVPATVIPEGSSAIDDNGIRWRSDEVAIIGSNNSVTVSFSCESDGSIDCAIGELTQIDAASEVNGWETVYNTSAAILGLPAESDAAFRRRRRRQLSMNSNSDLYSIDAALYSVPTVRGVKHLENYEPIPQIINSIILAPHSIWYCVDGGTNQEVAAAIMSKKAAGSTFNGSVSEAYTDPRSGQVYNVLFERPTDINVYVRVTVSPTALDADSICKDAIMAYAAGDIEGDQGFMLGEPLSPYEIASAINTYEPRLFVREVELSTDNSVWTPSEIAFAITELPLIERSRITVNQI